MEEVMKKKVRLSIFSNLLPLYSWQRCEWVRAERLSRRSLSVELDTVCPAQRGHAGMIARQRVCLQVAPRILAVDFGLE
jgi:hypothetical protein